MSGNNGMLRAPGSPAAGGSGGASSMLHVLQNLQCIFYAHLHVHKVLRALEGVVTIFGCKRTSEVQ